MSREDAWASARSVLAIRLDSLGDVLMTTPAIRALKQGAEGRRVTLLTSEVGAPVAGFVPEIDDLRIYGAPWMKATSARAAGAPEEELLHWLRRQAFDAAVVFTVYSQNPLPSALFCYLAGIPLRLAHCRENPYQLLTDWVREPEPGRMVRHEVRRQLDLVASVGCRTADERISLQAPDAVVREAARKLDVLGVQRDRPWALVHPGSSAPSRRYPSEHFAAAVRALTLEHGFQVVFTGSREERDLTNEIARMAAVPTHSLAGKLNIGGLCGVLKLAPLLISNNTGPVHIAAGLGTPVVDLYALTNPQHTPWEVPCRVLSHDVPCKYCYKSVCPEGHHDCLRKVAPSAVVRAALELMAEAGEARLQPREAMAG